MPQPSLRGLRILVTRPAGEGADAWAAAFAAAGAQPIAYPTVAFAPPESWQPVDQALGALDGYAWLIFTSQTTVAVVVGRLAGGCFPPGMHARIAAVGEATARAIAAAGGVVALVPEDARQEGLLAALGHLPAGTRLLLPLADGARPALAQALRAGGCVVDAPVVYRTVPIADRASPPPFDVATFASPSALRGFVARAGRARLSGKLVAVIGPTTADEAAAQRLEPVVAARPSVESLISAIAHAHPSQGDP